MTPPKSKDKQDKLEKLDKQDKQDKQEKLEKQETLPPKKKRKRKCHFCLKKLSLIELELTCHCSHSFCMSHFSPHSHKCQVNYKEKNKDKLQLLIPLIKNKQIETI